MTRRIVPWSLLVALLVSCVSTGSGKPQPKPPPPRPVPTKPPGPPKIALLQPEVDPRMAKNFDTAMFFSMWRKGFESDPRMKVVDRSKADAEVEVFVTYRQEPGINKTTGKMGMGTFFVVQAKILWRHIRSPQKVEEIGSILRNQAVTEACAKRVRDALVVRP
jgi:hypothetical protein